MSRPELSIIIPVYNEEARVGKTLKASLEYLRSKGLSAEILVVDDGSRDRTREVVESFNGQEPDRCGIRVLTQGANRGKGAAVKAGALAAQGDVILYMDADNATPLSELENILPHMGKSVDVAVGSRAVDRRKVKVHQPIYREAMGRIFNLLVQLTAAPGIWDTQCGFKAFTREAAGAVFPLQTIERFGFDVELIYIARRSGFRIKEFPVNWFDDPASKVRVFRDSTRMFLDLVVIRWNALRGLYKSPRQEAP